MEVREQLLRAAVKVYSTAGTRGATTRRIAQEAGVNEVTLFRHFGSKEALLRDAVQTIYDHSVLTRLPADPTDPESELMQWSRHHHQFLVRIRAMLRTSMAEFAEHPEHVDQACKLPIRIADELHAYLIRLRARGLARGAWNARAASALLMGALFGDATQRDVMPRRFPYSEPQAVRHYVKLFLTAIGTRPETETPPQATARAARGKARRRGGSTMKRGIENHE
jgi:AcrR family transcriptional regulator